MKEQKRKFIAWIKNHKKELICAGISIGLVIGVIAGIKNRNALMEFWDDMQVSIGYKKISSPVRKNKPKENLSHLECEGSAPNDSVKEEEAETVDEETMNLKELLDDFEQQEEEKTPFNVSNHVRNLHEGWHASAEKLAEAEERNIILLPGQTLVDGYLKRRTVA